MEVTETLLCDLWELLCLLVVLWSANQFNFVDTGYQGKNIIPQRFIKFELSVSEILNMKAVVLLAWWWTNQVFIQNAGPESKIQFHPS